MKLNSKEKKLFLTSLIILLILGISLTYNFDFRSSSNLLFDSDTARVIGDATEILGNHARLNVHPLFVILVQPIVLLINGIVFNKSLSIVIVSSIVSALSTLFIYKTLNLVNKNEKLNLLLSFIYLFSFSNIIFTSGIETYNFATLFLILLWYYFLKKLKSKKLDKHSSVVLIILGTLSLAFTITNFIVYLIILFVLLISKKIKIKNVIFLTILPLLLLVILNIGQKLIWQNTPLIFKTDVIGEKNSYGSRPSKETIKNVLVNDYYNSLISSDIKLNVDYGLTYSNYNYIINFKDINGFNFLLISTFYIVLILFLIKNFKKHLFENISLILIIFFNSSFHQIYGNDTAFLYSLHFLYPIILLLGINLGEEENKYLKIISQTFLSLFLVIELSINMQTFSKIIECIKDILNTNYLVANLGLLKTFILEIFLILVIISLILLIVKLLKKEEHQEKALLKYSLAFIFLIFIISIFISVETADKTNRLFLIKLGDKTGLISPKTKIDYLEKDFSNYFKQEINSVLNYKEEYDSFKQNYENRTNDYINFSDYYFFGFGNRRKLVYKKSCIIDIDSNEVVYSFSEKEHLIIPNDYTVVVQTLENDYIKIIEDDAGVHFIRNGKDMIIEGTNLKIDLYKFSGKYKNMKKVLYGELLFNIKDNKIYPNIIAYDEVWYRDAAISAMVLDKTNNLDLIRPWIDEITEIYDRQNSGEEETDNLGELLYLISKSENKNEALIEKIEEEAERLANENEKGYYPYGKTDFGEQYLYQNLWYKFGIESVGRVYKFDLSSIEEDLYSSMTWWSDYEMKSRKNQDANPLYPYLSFATRHKQKEGVLALNKEIYPLSWEKQASNANYDKFINIDARFKNERLSPLHSWAAAEMLLFIIDEDN